MVLVLMLALCQMAASAEAVLLATPEEVLAANNISNTEYLEDFIQAYQITPEYAQVVDLTGFYENYVEGREAEKYDFTYLLNRSANEHTGDLEAEKIQRVLWFWNSENRVVVRLYDLKEMVVYYGDYNILYNIQEGQQAPLAREEKQAVLRALEDCQVMQWESCYANPSRQISSWLAWTLAIEYEDGSLFTSSGAGSFADDLPATFSQVKDALQKEIAAE